MIRLFMITCIVALAAACTGPADGSRVRDSSPRLIPEPTSPGIHISGSVQIGVSTVK